MFNISLCLFIKIAVPFKTFMEKLFIAVYFYANLPTVMLTTVLQKSVVFKEGVLSGSKTKFFFNMETEYKRVDFQMEKDKGEFRYCHASKDRPGPSTC